MENSIEITNVSKKYVINDGTYLTLRDLVTEGLPNLIKKKKKRERQFWALKNVTFNIKKGEVFGIIGKNGAGKSTLLKILSRIIPPTTGEVKIRGRVSSMLEIGTGFHSELSGRENVYLNGAILGMKRREIQKKFNDIVEFSGIGKFIDIPVKKYSSGMQVRLAFSVAAYLNPEILLIDEVLAVGDLSFQRKSLRKMHEITKEEGRTVVFVSHNTSAIDNLCSKVALLEKGKLVDVGETSKIISEYVTNYVAEEPPQKLKARPASKKIKIQITDFWLENSFRKRVKTVKIGNTCYFIFKYKTTAKSKQKNVDIGFAIKSISEQPLVNNYTSYSNQLIERLPLQGKFVFKVNKMPLTVGRYRIGYRITINGKEDDYLPNAAEFDVEPGEFYVPGVVVNQTHSPFYLDGAWQNE